MGFWGFGVLGFWGAKKSYIKWLLYREFSPYANFITANFISAVFQNYY